MIDSGNFKALLKHLGFAADGNIFTKIFGQNEEVFLKVDFDKKELIYPENGGKGLKVNERQTCNISVNENFVVFECVYRLLEKGYKPEHIELEPKWKLGHGASGGRADILVRDQEGKELLIIECKTHGREFDKAWKDMLSDGGQLFSYAQQIQKTEFLCLYAASFDEKNNQLTHTQRIISHKDNPKVIEQTNNEIKIKSFREANDVKQRFQVWKEVYQLEYTEVGIFEENIQPYQIGKSKYTLEEDTKPLTSGDISGKYHEFTTLLRAHNIARRETAFEVLVNLFLCKIVDEDRNPNDLKFYWKGIAYDNYFDFIDRLQELYKIGMDKFLKEEIVYISNAQIDGAFWTVKNKENATKKVIQYYFRQLKFFTNNAFSLISINNEKQFTRNTKVLVQILQMWQNLRLKSEQQSQFLGDMFEYFLDNSIKQSEGQFFTPLPICKFVVMSLPLAQKVQTVKEPLKVIDYACGAGHFLTEYGHQIKPLVEQYKMTEVEPCQKIMLSNYYQNIVGIEKEDRLVKVAKVSAYMHQQNDIQIIEQDALADAPNIKENSFDVLVANPPFAVKDFLLGLSEKEQEKYELIKTTGLNSGTNTVQCFFLERAKQLMAADGVMGVIVPSSILSNSDNTHVLTREILLQHFDFVAITELGSNTFGKTGTNTVVLFLRRKGQQPSQAEHFKNRVGDFFGGIRPDDEALKIHRDLHFIQKYCKHINIAYNDYKPLLGCSVHNFDTLTPLLQYDMFKDYQRNFEESTEIKNLKKSKSFQRLGFKAQTYILNQRLLHYLTAIEQDKLYYFMLAYSNPQKVLIVKTPTDGKEAKKFLGYEWSGAKGKEGIKYYGGHTVYEIETPMFDPNNPLNPTKINYFIQQNFNNQPVKHLPETCAYVALTDMLDFSRTEFNKAISLSFEKKTEIETKWDLVRLGDVVDVNIGGTPSREFSPYFEGNNLWVSISEMNNQVITDTKEKITDEAVIKSNVKLIPKGTTLLSFKLSIGKTAIAGKDLYTNEAIAGLIPLDKQTIMDKYIYYLFNAKLINLEAEGNKTFGQSLNSKTLKEEVKIPLPPLDIQQKIVAECEAADEKAAAAVRRVEMLKQEVEKLVKESFESKNVVTYKIGHLTETSSGGTPLSAKTEYYSNGNIPWINSGEVGKGEIYKTENFITELGLKESSAKIFPKETVLLAMYGATAGKVSVLKFEAATNQAICGILPNEKFISKYLALQLETMYQYLLDIRTGVARENLSQSKIQEINVKIPPISEQKALVEKVEALEAQIKAAEAITSGVLAEKEAILEKYL